MCDKHDAVIVADMIDKLTENQFDLLATVLVEQYMIKHNAILVPKITPRIPYGKAAREQYEAERNKV